MMAEPAGSEFPVTWERPSDPALSWEFDDMHTPLPLAPLAGDYSRMIAHGIAYRFRHFGLPIRFHCRVINHFAYFADELLAPESDLPEIRQRSIEQRRAHAQHVRRYWEEEVLPVLRETYAWMRAAPVETGSLAEVAAIWEEAWARARRLWELHFMTNAGSYQSLDDLADLYESLVPGARPDEGLSLVQGLPNDLHSVQRDLYRLAEQARASPGVAERIIQDPHRAIAALPRVQGGGTFLAALQNFLATHGHLGQPFDDLAYPSWGDEPTLLLTELRKRLLSPDEDPERRRQRQGGRADREQWRGVKPPKTLGKPPPPPPPSRFERPPQEQSEDRLLRGTGACAGMGRGPARIVVALEDFARVQSGDVVVCPSSNPSWVPLFGIIAGLVTNTGGVLSHAAVVAREFGVPAVVGTGVATERLRDGQLVEVDGTAGEVRLL